jgi:hypothetical protein
MPNTKFLEIFKTIMSVIEEWGGNIGNYPGAIKTALKVKYINQKNATDSEMEVATKTVKERYLTVAMLSSDNKLRYGKLTEYLQNDYTKGIKVCTKTVTKAYNLIINYRQSSPSQQVESLVTLR